MGNSLSNSSSSAKITQHPHIVFLTRREAEKALREADELDDFITQVDESSINRNARRHLAYIPVDGPTHLDIDLPELTFDIRICWLHTTAEGGMPHTRPPNLICIPIYLNTSDLTRTLQHEIVHIDQRNHPAKWVQWCIQNNWTLLDSSRIPQRWLDKCRLNPDTMLYRFWAYQNQWVPLPLFERNDIPDIRIVRVKWWDMKTGDLLVRAPEELQPLLTDVANPEHPFEIAAYKNIIIVPSSPVKKI